MTRPLRMTGAVEYVHLADVAVGLGLGQPDIGALLDPRQVFQQEWRFAGTDRRIAVAIERREGRCCRVQTHQVLLLVRAPLHPTILHQLLLSRWKVYRTGGDLAGLHAPFLDRLEGRTDGAAG